MSNDFFEKWKKMFQDFFLIYNRAIRYSIEKFILEL